MEILKEFTENLIRAFIINNVEKHPQDIVRVTAQEFGITRQGVFRHLRKLIDEGALEASGKTRSRKYFLKILRENKIVLPISKNMAEDHVWRESVKSVLENVQPNVRDICYHGFTEMFNNVIDHSEGTEVIISITYKLTSIEMKVLDNGVGIFKKIKEGLGLEDERHAILELTKGKVTTDPEKHTGEGIFFTTRMFDEFSIRSGLLFFLHKEQDDDWLIEAHKHLEKGAFVEMRIHPQSPRTTKEVFDKYTAERDDFGFTRTHVPVTLARYEGEKLVSRSQAKRLLARFDKFKEVFLDFAGVKTIGPAFADEIFRVYRRQNPQIKLVWIRTNEDIEKMINLAIHRPDDLPDDSSRLLKKSHF